MREYSDDLFDLSKTNAALAEEISGFTSLEQILNWMPTKGIRLSAIDMITQDEFCHDLIVPINEHEFLSFGMT